MKIFVDSADLSEIQKYLEMGICDGVTTNPTIMLKAGVKGGKTGIKKRSMEIAKLIRPRPVSLEVTTDDHDEMVKQAKEMASWADNAVIKIPFVNSKGEPSLTVIKKLADQNIRINVTAMMSFNQCVLATKAGATYISLFCGRVEDEGNDATPIVAALRGWLDDWGYKAEIIAASSRTTLTVQNWAQAGSHIITITPAILAKMIKHSYATETAKQFLEDAQKALKSL